MKSDSSQLRGFAGCALICALVLLPMSFAGCASGQAGVQEIPGYAQTQGRWFVDGKGRTLILHSVNLCAQNKRPPFLPWQTKEEVQVLRKWGFNSVRYLIVWEAVEPEPGRYDDEYLDKVAERLDWCREAGLKVILDMHQDVYSRKYGGDGAPQWACLDNNTPFKRVPGAWYLAYSSAAVIAAFDSFWANKPVGGVGIQDRFIAAWQHVANRFRDDTNIVGYDLLNEPYYGSAIYTMFTSVAVSLGKRMGTQSQMRLMKLMRDPSGAVEFGARMIRELERRDEMFEFMDEASAPAQAFERKSLQKFYDALVAAIRQVDPNHICLIEPAGGPMQGTRLRTAICLPRDASGEPFKNVAFAPHHYDFSYDLGYPYEGNVGSVRKYLARGASAGDKMTAPTWFGEWGAHSRSSEHNDRLVRDHLDAFDSLLCGWAFWEYGKAFKDVSFRKILGRPYAEVIAGTPTRMSFTNGRFELEFHPLPEGGVTTVWVPPDWDAQIKATISGGNVPENWRDADGLVYVRCPAKASQCSITIDTRKI